MVMPNSLVPEVKSDPNAYLDTYMVDIMTPRNNQLV
jgi:hypothetical protein